MKMRIAVRMADFAKTVVLSCTKLKLPQLVLG